MKFFSPFEVTERIRNELNTQQTEREKNMSGYKWTPRQKRQYIEGALGDIDRLTTQQGNIIQKLADHGLLNGLTEDRWDAEKDKIMTQLIEVTERIRKVNEVIQSRMEGSNWGKYN